jgi:alpha-1,3-rhamnosyl/mannosyltransferase
MRVGLDGYPLSEPRTGVGHYTLELARAVAALAPADQFELLSPAPFAASSIEEINRAGAPNLRAVYVKTSRMRGHWWAVGLPLYEKQARLDLFHGTNFEIPFWNRRSVVTIHDLSALLHAEKHRDSLVRRARLRLPVTAKLAKKIITPTEAVRREVCDHLRVKPDKVIAIPSSARRSFRPMAFEQTVEIRKRLSIADHFLLFVGTLEPRKNLLTLLRAFEQILRQTSLRPQLVIAGGEGWLMEEMFAFIKSAGIEDRLRLTGYLADEDLCALYSSCGLFIYPSLYEGFGLPPLEAMACGAPVVAGRVPALREVLGEAAAFVEPLNVGQLAAEIVELLENEEARRRLAANGLKQAAKFSWEETARRTLQVYRDVIHRRRG